MNRWKIGRQWAGRACGIAVGLIAVSSPLAAHAEDSAGAVDGPGSGAGSGPIAPRHWELSLGATFSDGSYGQPQRTDVAAFPLSLRYAAHGFWVRVTVPYVILRGPINLLDTPQPGEGGGKVFGPGGAHDGAPGPPFFLPGEAQVQGGGMLPHLPSIHSDGLGDISLTAGYRFDLGERTHLSMSSRLKIPTASVEDGLGTGKVDVTLGGDIGRDIGRATITVGTRRRFTGRPAGTDLRDTWAIAGDFGYRLGKGVMAGLDYEWRQSVTPGFSPAHDLTAWTSLPLKRDWRLELYGGTGFGRGSASAIGGVSVRWKFD